MSIELNNLNEEEWKDVKQIVVFGYGRQGRKAIETLKNDFEIIAIVDNDKRKTGGRVDDIPILFCDDAWKLLKTNKIIVAVTERYYSAIARQLQKNGLQEYIDFVSYQQFINEWYFKYRGKLYMIKTDLPITSNCTLNCEKCHIFIPYWKNKVGFDLEMLKRTVDRYFQYVDYVFDMDILGGEPLLYRYLDDILEYVGMKYRRKIGYLGLTTNGTMLPKTTTLDVIKKYDIHVSISDYGLGEKYTKRVNELCKKLDNAEIVYMRNKDIQWFDFRFPTDEVKYQGEMAVKHMQYCNTIYHVIHEEKFYCCGTAWAAQMSGCFPASEYGYVNLAKSNMTENSVKEDILACSMGRVKNGYLSFCRICGGFGLDNDKKVETAKQLVK